MKRLLKVGAVVFSCIGAFISGPAMAQAAVQNASPDLLPRFERPEDPLPRSLDSWGAEADPLSPGSFLPQQRKSVQPPFIDWSKFEAGGFVGVVMYSDDFDADADIAGGLTARVPVPGLPGHWGLWAALNAAGMERDLPSYYPDRSGVWYSGMIGADYDFTDGEVFLLRGQAGLTYNFWNGLQGLHDNFAGVVGLDIGFYWVKFNHRTTVSLNPQITFSAGEWYAMFGLEIQVQF